MKCGPLCSFIFSICPVQYSFSWNLDTKFCLHAAGGIFVQDNFNTTGGKIEVSNSSAGKIGGAVLRSSCGVCQNLGMAVGSGRSTPGSELKRFP